MHLGHAFTSWSRSSRRRIFPDGLFGSESTKRYSRGRLKRASEDARQCASSSASVAVATTTATTRCPRRSSGGADDCDFEHAGMSCEHVLDLERMDVLAARDDHVVDAAVDPEIALLVEMARVARVVPAVSNRLRVCVGPVPVPAEGLVRREVDRDLPVDEAEPGVDGGPACAAGLARAGRARS